VPRLDLSGQSVDYVGFTRGGQVLITVSGDGRLRLWRRDQELAER
jgi:hypothetical protein